MNRRGFFATLTGAPAVVALQAHPPTSMYSREDLRAIALRPGNLPLQRVIELALWPYYWMGGAPPWLSRRI